MPPLLGEESELGGHPQTLGRDKSLHSAAVTLRRTVLSRSHLPNLSISPLILGV